MKGLGFRARFEESRAIVALGQGSTPCQLRANKLQTFPEIQGAQ